MKKVLLCLVILTMFVGCGKQMASEKLAQADSLIAAEKNDSAYMLLSGIKESHLATDEDRAHYYLLMTRASILTGNTVPPDSCINYAISYYEQGKDYSNLADAYFYKGYLSLRKDSLPETMFLFKIAEKHAKLSEDLLQQYKIAEAISYINGIGGKYNLQIKYAFLSLKLASILKDKNRIAYSLGRISDSYLHLEMKDSADHYAKKIIPYIDDIRKEDLPYFLTIIGNAYKNTDTTKAKWYYKKALSYQELPSTTEGLADIYYEEGNQEEAYRLWKRALSICDMSSKDNIIYNILEYDILHGNTDNVLEKVNEIMDIKDSIQDKLENDTLKDLQLRFDHEVEKHELDQKLNRSLWAIAGLIALVMAIVIYVLFKRYQQRLLWTQTQIQIDNYTTQIRRYEESGADVKEIIEELQAKINAIMEDKSQKLNRGLKLYNDVNNNESMIRWSKEDYDMFIDYFDVINHPIVKKHRKEHEKLTPRTLTFLLLCSMGKSDEDIRQIMALSPEGLRSMRFRVNHNSN